MGTTRRFSRKRNDQLTPMGPNISTQRALSQKRYVIQRKAIIAQKLKLKSP